MWLILTAGWWCSLATLWSPADKPRPEPGCGHAQAAAAIIAHEAAADRRQPSRDATDTDVLHYNLDLEIDPDLAWIGGSNVMTVRSLVDDLTVFHFQLDDALTISAVEVNDGPVAWQRIDFPTVEVTLDHAYNTDEEFDLRVVYDGHPSSDGYFTPAISFTTHEGEPIVFTLSEPWYSYAWWPTKADNTDKATAEQAYTVPDTMVVASNGTLAGTDDLGDGRKRYRWATDYQMVPYLFSFSATNYNVYSETYTYDGHSMPFELYAFPEEDTPDRRTDWLEIMDMTDVFNEWFGLYPFIAEKYGLYQFMMGGGMEHQTITGQRRYWGSWEWINAHELAHQWWGDMITCATWHDVWLNEGFASYSEAIWYENKPGAGGEDALHEHMEFRRPEDVSGSVYCYDISDVGRIFSHDLSYDKGAWVVHMLRHVVGDDTFFDILAAYRAAFEYGSATTDDFQGLAENVCGEDLDWYFDTWIYDVGAPGYEYGWRQEMAGGQNYVELYLTQTQSPSYPIYTMPIDVVTTSGDNETIHVVWNDEPAEHLLFATDAPIDSLALDPKHWILTDPKDATAIPFVEGPPKIVTVAPAPGSEATPAEALAVAVQFHKDVVADAAHFTLAGDTTGSVEFSFVYDGPTQTATLTLESPLPADDYTLTVSDEVVDVAAELALDGELHDPRDPAALPSGDGLPGGSAVIEFTVLVGGDLDGDGDVDHADLGIFLSDWGCTGQNCVGDIDGDGDTDHADLGILLANWGYGT